MRLVLWIAAMLLGFCSAVAAAPDPYPGPPPFDELRANALKTFLSSNNFNGSPQAPLTDFYTEAVFDASCRPLADLRTFAETAFAERQFQDAGPDVRYPRETVAVSRFKQGVGKGSPDSFDVVMMVLEVKKGPGFTCHYHLGAYARREDGGPRAESLKQSTELASDLKGVFAAVSASVSKSTQSGAVNPEKWVQDRSAWLNANSSIDPQYVVPADAAQRIVATTAQAIQGCCATISLRVIRSGSPPIPYTTTRLGHTCIAFPDTFEVPTILCDENFVRNLNVIIRTFVTMKSGDFTSDRMMVRFHEAAQSSASSVSVAGNTLSSDGAALDAIVAEHLRLALLFIGAHEAGHLQKLDFDVSRSGSASVSEDNTQLLISELCRHYDGMRQDGYHLDVFDSPLKPGAPANAIWMKFQKRSPVVDAAAARLFAAERYADQFSVELLLAYLGNGQESNFKDLARQRSLLVETIYAVSLGIWHQQLYDFEDAKCGKVGLEELSSCFLFSDNGYVGSKDLFDEYHRNILERGVDAMVAIIRERSPWMMMPESDRTFSASEGQLTSFSDVDQVARSRFEAELQQTALLSRLMDMPLKMSAAGCLAGINVAAGTKRPIMGLFFVPVEMEAKSISPDDLGFD
jgi:hypothetical protein